MTTRTPAFWGYPLPPHDYPYYWVILDPKSKEDKVKGINLKNLSKFQIFEFWNKLYTRHTFWSCLIRRAIWNGSDEYFWRYRADTILSTDGQTDKVKPVYPPFNFVEAGGMIKYMLPSILPALTASLAITQISVELLAIFSAVFTASSTSWSTGNTLLTNPVRKWLEICRHMNVIGPYWW